MQSRVIIGAVAGVVLLMIALIIATLSRGFNFNDEAFVYSLIKSASAAPGEFFGFQYLLHPLFELLNENVFAFRVIRLVAYVGLGLALTATSHNILSRFGVSMSTRSWILAAAIAQLGTLAAWGYPPRYFGYNELSALLAQLCGGILILLLARSVSVSKGETRKAPLALWGALGALMVLLAFAKITSIILVGLLIVAVLVVARNPLPLFVRLISLIVGACATTLTLAVLGVPVVDYVSDMFGFLLDPSLRVSNGYSASALVIDYASSIVLTVRALTLPAILMTLILFASHHGLRATSSSALKFPNDGWALARSGTAVLAVVLAVSLLIPKDASLWNGLGVGVALLALVAILALLPIGGDALALGERPRDAIRVVVMASIVFFVAPFANAVGTNNPIVGQTVFSASLWAAGAGVGLALMWEKAHSSGALRLIPLGIAAVLVANASLWVLTDVFIHPYGTAPYFSQSSRVSFTPLRDISLTAADARLVDWLQKTALEEKATNVPTTVIGNSGALFAFNNSPWASPWMGENSSASLTRSCLADPPTTLYLLQPGTQVSGGANYEAVVGGLRNCGIKFPSDFEKVADHADPDPGSAMTLWRYDR